MTAAELSKEYPLLTPDASARAKQRSCPQCQAPMGFMLHWPAPSQALGTSQVRGSVCPRATLLHWPERPGRSHARHVAPQPVSQQTPSTQLPEMHSLD